MRKVFFHIVTILLLIVIGRSGYLSFKELSDGTGCPALGIVPVCFIVFICSLVPLINHLSRGKVFIFYSFTSFTFLLALFASIGHVSGNIQCPETTGGIPMCYILSILFLIIIVMKFLHYKISEKQ